MREPIINNEIDSHLRKFVKFNISMKCFFNNFMNEYREKNVEQIYLKAKIFCFENYIWLKLAKKY